MVFFANLGVNLRGCLCGVLQYASAQPLDFLDLDKKSSFLNWKLASAQKAFLDGNYPYSPPGICWSCHSDWGQIFVAQDQYMLAYKRAQEMKSQALFTSARGFAASHR
ncbi:MAG: hypothetical protein ACQET7_12700 [Thermodesulfobacteriota bacterium]